MADDGSGATKIKVEAYSGYRVGETPRKVFLNNRGYDVAMIVYRKRIVHLDNYDEEEHFRVQLNGYGPVDIMYRPRVGEWEMKKAEPEKKFVDML